MSTIKTGDLVYVATASACCGSTELLGHVFVVAKVRDLRSGRCRICGYQAPPGEPAAWYPLRESWVLMSRLKKIDPLGDEETEKQVHSADEEQPCGV